MVICKPSTVLDLIVVIAKQIQCYRVEMVPCGSPQSVIYIPLAINHISLYINAIQLIAQWYSMSHMTTVRTPNTVLALQ